jgi:hypothetical protein
VTMDVAMPGSRRREGYGIDVNNVGIVSLVLSEWRLSGNNSTSVERLGSWYIGKV